jgi:serine/threonine protein kinase, bacterial
MGEVYFAQHPRSLRPQALKILRTDICADDAYRRRLIREADVAGSLGTDAATMLRDRYPVGASANQVAAVVAAIPSAV